MTGCTISLFNSARKHLRKWPSGFSGSSITPYARMLQWRTGVVTDPLRQTNSGREALTAWGDHAGVLKSLYESQTFPSFNDAAQFRKARVASYPPSVEKSATNRWQFAE